MLIMILRANNNSCNLENHFTFYKENKLLINECHMIGKTKNSNFIFLKMKPKEDFFQGTELTKIYVLSRNKSTQYVYILC